MNRKKFIDHLKLGNLLCTANELKTCLVEQMLEYIEKRITLTELLELSEIIRDHYFSKASDDTLVTVNALHKINKELHNQTQEQLPEEELIFKVDDLLTILTKI